jgi:translation initiation factor IF-1
MSEGIRTQHAEQIFGKIIEHLDGGDIRVRQFDGVERTIEAAETHRIGRLPAGSLIEFEWRYAAASRSNVAQRAKPIGTEHVPESRNRDLRAAGVAR